MRRKIDTPPTLQRPKIGSWSRRSARSVETTPIHEQVFTELRTALMCGTFAPGDAITIRDLAASFGVSPMPVRDALGRLVAERALEMPNARSVRVPRMTYREYVELCDFRALVEGYALERAYTTSPATDLDESERLNELYASSLRKGQYAESLVRALRFMFSLYSGGSADAILMPHIEKLWLRSGPLLPLRQHAMFSRPGGEERQVNLHRAVIAALRANKVAQAVDLFREDLKDNYRAHLSEKDFRAP